MLSDEATIHISGKVNKQNVCTWESEYPHATVEHITDSLKVSVWCRLLNDCLIGSSFSAEATVTSSNYLAMTENIVYPHLQELQNGMFFQKDGAQLQA
jgi:hypothetical protein